MPRVSIGKHFKFEAAHNLPGGAVYGDCSRLHGHRYEGTLVIEGDVNDLGWVANFKELKQVINDIIISRYDHKYLNEVFDGVPTAENLVLFIHQQLSSHYFITNNNLTIKRLTLYETADSFAEITS